MYREIIGPSYHMAHNISHIASENYLIHSHAFYELYYYVSGDVRILYDGTEYVLTPHTFIIFVPDVFHGLWVKSEGPYERYTAHFTEDLIAPRRRDALMGNLPTEETIRSRAETHPYILQNAQELDILPLMQEYEKLIRFPEPLRNAMAGAVTEAILARYLLHAYEAKKIVGIQPYHKGKNELAPILSYIHQNLTQKMSLDDLCDRFHLSKGKLNQLFHQQLEMATMDYVTKRRVSYAQQLLLNGVPAAQAGSAAGFGDYAGFYRAYKKALGHSPSDDHRSMSGNNMMRSIYQESAIIGPAVADDSSSTNTIWETNRSTQASEIDISVLRDSV